MMPNRMGCWLRSRFFAVVISCILIISVFPASAATVTETIFSENFEGAFGDDTNGWSVGDSNCWANYDAWDDTFHTSHNGESSAWVADMGQHDEEVYGSNDANVNIPDNDGTVTSSIKLTGAPSGKKISTMDVYFNIKHPYVGDLYVDIADENADYPYVLWNREGGSQDNILKRENCISKFNEREYVNQIWKLRATDKASQDTGYIDYWSISAYYDAGTNYQYREYDNYMDAYMLRTVDLSGYNSPTLTFSYKMPSVEEGYDYGQIKVNGVEIKKYNKVIADWKPETINLSDYAGESITIEWSFHSDKSVRKEGWYIDDIAVKVETQLLLPDLSITSEDITFEKVG